jgi:hypothetical protein
MKDIQKAVERLNADELRSCLKLALHHIALLKEQAAPPGRAIAGLIGLHDKLVNRDDAPPSRDPAPGCTRVHIVTGHSFAGCMKLALRELGLADTHNIITISDNFAIGPINRLDTPEGRRTRYDWFRHNIASAALGEVDDPEEAYGELLRRLDQIPEQAEIIVWTSRSVYEQTGMRYALHLLRRKPHPIRICDACAICEEPDRRPDDAVTCRRSGEIGPDKLREAIKRAESSPILSASGIRRLADEWTSVAEQGGVLRVWEDDAVREVPADHFDPYLLETLDRVASAADADGFVKAARVVGEAVGYGEQDIGDEYFEYRLRELIYAGVLEIRGVPAGMRSYSIRRKKRETTGMPLNR